MSQVQGIQLLPFILLLWHQELILFIPRLSAMLRQVLL